MDEEDRAEIAESCLDEEAYNRLPAILDPAIMRIFWCVMASLVLCVILILVLK